MASAGVGGNSRIFNTASKNPPPTTISSYQNALEQAPADYTDIYKGYKNILNNPSQINRILYNPISYQEDPDVASSISNLGDLATTGGYSQQAQNDIRARGVSPIRSIFATAQQNVERQKALQGGYSPNYAAVTAKMTREKANEISQQVTNINAQLAQSIAQNRIASAPGYASAAGAESARQLGAKQFNASNQLDTDKTNAGFQQQGVTNQLDALNGLRGLYGTTPAAAALFGDQALQASRINSSNAAETLNNNTRNNQMLLGSIQ